MFGAAYGGPPGCVHGGYIAGAFAAAGLAPAGDNGGWLQAFPQGANVIGVLPGASPAFNGQAVVVSAHYDHLGPNHPGADDNEPCRDTVFIPFVVDQFNRTLQCSHRNGVADLCRATSSRT